MLLHGIGRTGGGEKNEKKKSLHGADREHLGDELDAHGDDCDQLGHVLGGHLSSGAVTPHGSSAIWDKSR